VAVEYTNIQNIKIENQLQFFPLVFFLHVLNIVRKKSVCPRFICGEQQLCIVSYEYCLVKGKWARKIKRKELKKGKLRAEEHKRINQ